MEDEAGWGLNMIFKFLRVIIPTHDHSPLLTGLTLLVFDSLELRCNQVSCSSRVLCLEKNR